MADRLREKMKASIWENSNLRSYLGEVARRHGIVDSLALPNMRDLPPIQIEKLFVQPELSVELFNSESKDWPKGESLLECLSSNRSVVLLGDPGSGKTTLINWVSWLLSSGLARGVPKFLGGLLPVPCVLREVESSKFEGLNDIGDLALLVADRLLGARLTEKIKSAIKECILSNNYILMLDGVDEISYENRKVVAKWIALANKGNAYVIATSRIVGYDEYPIHTYIAEGEAYLSRNTDRIFNQEKNLEIEHFFPKNSDLKAMELSKNLFFKNKFESTFQVAVLRYLMPFDDKKIESFIANWYLQRSGSEVDASERSADLLAALKESKATHELARTPNLLSLISIVHRERAHLPDGRALLYKEISNAYINTIDKQKKIKIDNELLRHDWIVREGWISFVGFKMQVERSEGGGSKSFAVLAEKNKVLNWLEEAMNPFFSGDASQHAIVFLDWVARRSGLLLPRGEDRYAFVHLSFQEYFCARYISSQVVTPKFIRGVFTENDLVTYKALDAWARNSAWRESFIYLFELISSESNSDWMSFLVEKLFSPNHPEIGVYNDSAKLIARILANVHISISDPYRHALARKCSCNDNREVESALAKAGFAISFGAASTGLLSLSKVVRETENVDLIVDECNDLKGIYKISFHNKKLKNYSGLKKFENAEALNLINCELAGLSFLKGMNKLKQFRMERTKVNSFSHMAYLSNLLYLSLSGTNVSDISELKNFLNLITVDLDDSKVVDISPLGGCVNLRFVSLKNTKITDVSCFKSLNKLKYVSLSNLSLSDFSVLSELKNLEYLDLSRSNFHNVEYICDIESLEDLNLSYTSALNLSLLSKCKMLKKLSLNGASEEQVSGLDSVKWVEELWLMGAKISDLELISGMTGLKNLVLDDSSVRDLSPLKKLSNLEHLDIERTNVDDVSVLSDLKNLKHLFLRDSKVKSIDALKSKADLMIHGFKS